MVDCIIILIVFILCELSTNSWHFYISDKNRTAFNWSDTIIQVLQSRSDRELSLKKLCKKVLAEYQAVKGDKLYESYEKLVAKFHKKVNKTVGVKVLKLSLIHI